MAGPARYRATRGCTLALQSRTCERDSGRSASPHERRCDGRAFQGPCDAFARMAHACRVPIMITYRDATSADAATLERIFDTVFCETFGHLYRPEDLKTFLSS